VVTVGVAVTVPPVEELRVDDGDQVYVFAPLAFSVADAPLHIVGELTVTVGVGFTVTTAVAAAVHDPVVPTTVYVVVTVGLAVTFAPVVALKPVDGDQL
jgi:hypothetical protein